MKSFFNILRLLCLVLVISVGCEKEPIINFTVTEYTISEKGGSQQVSFSTNQPWKATISGGSWLTIDKSEGDEKSSSFRVNIESNFDYSDRTATISINTKKLTKSIIIKQSQNQGLLFTQREYNISSAGESINVELKSNVEYDVNIPLDNANWISKITSKALISSNLSFNIAANNGFDTRQGKIIVKGKNSAIADTITIFQKQKDAIILTTKTFNISDTAVVLSAELRSNVQYVVNIPLIAQNWITQLTTKAINKESLQFSISRNLSHENRLANIIIQHPLSNLADTLRIIQQKAPGLPSLTTKEANDISLNSAISGGNITNDGGTPILARGICWNALGSPTIQNSKIGSGDGIGDFTANISGLNAGTKYYARAYATNTTGTSYGNQIVFTTRSIVATPVISPVGGTYITAQTITISCATEGAEIRYTLNGTEPVITSALYTTGIPINKDVTIKVKAFKKDWIESSVATEVYVINLNTLIIQGSSNAIQHIDASGDFIFRLNDLNNKEVLFVFSNTNTNVTTTLPLINGSVANMRTAESPQILHDPNFVISGKQSITDFNNDPWKYPADGMTKSQYQQYSASQPEKYIFGSSEFLYDEAGNAHSSTVRKVISANGKNLLVWVDDECWGPTSLKKYYITQQMIDEFAPKFLNTGTDNDVYEWVSNICGAPWGENSYSNLIPVTDDIHIWLTDINNDNKTTGTITVGYFFSRDNFLKSTYSKSNEKLLFTLDAVVFATTTNGTWDLSHYWPMKLISTLAHEFTHMIYFYQNNILGRLSGHTAINEMSAQCVEDLVSNKILSNGPRGVPYATSGAGSLNNNSGRLPLYNSYNDYNLLEWSSKEDERLLNYSKTYALGAYLMRNYGGANFIKELIQNNTTGITSIVNAVNINGGRVGNYGEILQMFGAANLLSEKTTMPVGYIYNTGSWTTSNVNGTTYELGSINLYNYSNVPYVYNTLPSTQKPGSNTYFRGGTNLKGTKEWYFQGLNANTKLTVVIK